MSSANRRLATAEAAWQSSRHLLRRDAGVSDLRGDFGGEFTARRRHVIHSYCFWYGLVEKEDGHAFLLLFDRRPATKGAAAAAGDGAPSSTATTGGASAMVEVSGRGCGGHRHDRGEVIRAARKTKMHAEQR
mmetsp:Transcript_49940/g.106209  ORF Transcript_49940/g.106209 Transcript_49940/m.106209 type:complete len:132 (-) Transcript_49940:116-511(-)